MTEAFAEGGKFESEEKVHIGEIKDKLGEFMADVVGKIKGNNANLQAMEMEYEAVEKEKGEALEESMKEQVEEAIEKAEKVKAETTERAEGTLCKLQSSLDDAKFASFNKMQSAEATIALRIKEEVDSAVAQKGSVDRFSAVSAKLANEIPSIIMHETIEEMRAIFEGVKKGAEEKEVEFGDLVGSLGPRLQQIFDGLEGGLEKLRVEESVRCQESATSLTRQIVSNIEENSLVIRNALTESSSYVKSFFGAKRGEMEEAEFELVSEVEKLLVVNNAAEAKVWALEANKCTAWWVAEEERGGQFPDSPMLLDAVGALVESCAGNLAEQVERQADEALSFSEAQTMEIFHLMHDSTVGNILSNLVDTVEILEENARSFGEFGEVCKVEEGVILEKEREARERRLERMKGVGEGVGGKNSIKEVKKGLLLMEAESWVGKVRMEFGQLVEGVAKAKKDGDERAEEIKTISAVQKKLLTDEAEHRVKMEEEEKARVLKKAREEEEEEEEETRVRMVLEAENAEKAKNFLVTPTPLKKGAAMAGVGVGGGKRRSVDLRDLATPIKFEEKGGQGQGHGQGQEDDVLSTTDEEKEKTPRDLSHCVTLSFLGSSFEMTGMTSLDNNFFCTVFGKSKSKSKFSELGRTEVSMTSGDPAWKMPIIVDNSLEFALLSVWVLRANLKGTEELADHGVFGDFDFTFDQLLETSRGEMSITLGERGCLTLFGKRTTAEDLKEPELAGVKVGGDSMKQARRQLFREIELKKMEESEAKATAKALAKGIVGAAVNMAVDGVKLSLMKAEEKKVEEMKVEEQEQEPGNESASATGTLETLDTADMILEDDEKEKRDTVAIVESIEREVDEMKHINNSIVKIKLGSPEKMEELEKEQNTHTTEPVKLLERMEGKEDEKEKEKEEEKKVGNIDKMEEALKELNNNLKKQWEENKPELEENEEEEHLVERTFNGANYLVEEHSEKGFTNEDNQNSVGKLSNNEVDFNVCDSSVEVEEDNESGVFLTEREINGDLYLVEEPSGNVFTNGEEQNFVGRLVDGLIVGEQEEEEEEEEEELLVEREILGVTWLVEESSGFVYNNDDEQSFVGRLDKDRDRGIEYVQLVHDEPSEISMGSEVTIGGSSVYLTEREINGKTVLVEDSLGKVYDLDQNYIGKIRTTIDFENVKVNENENEKKEELEEIQVRKRSARSAEKEALIDLACKGIGYLMEDSSGKVFNGDQFFIGKYDKKNDVIDFDAENSSSDDDE